MKAGFHTYRCCLLICIAAPIIVIAIIIAASIILISQKIVEINLICSIITQFYIFGIFAFIIRVFVVLQVIFILCTILILITILKCRILLKLFFYPLFKVCSRYL